MRTAIFPLLLLLQGSVTAQKVKKEDKQLQTALQVHIAFLSADKLEGRRAGTPGEALAADYIAQSFAAAGLSPKGTMAYRQPFEISDGRQIGPATLFSINGTPVRLETDYFPLPFSSNGSVEAMPSVALQEAGMPWFLDLKELVETNTGNPHFDLAEAIRKKGVEMINRGATAIILYNTSATADGLAFNGKVAPTPLSVPVIYVTGPAARKYLSDVSASLDIKLKTEIVPQSRTGNNVIGFLDNGAARTVILGAHYDHLGYGEDGTSLLRSGSPQIHNGADDNASGVAGLIELARMLKASKQKTTNYLFIAFSGEELGLFGSKYFVAHPTVELATVNYMINMDMVGRLNDSSGVLTIGGYGTTPLWGQLYKATGKKSLYHTGLTYRFDSSGTGPSDHTSFYRKDIPVLFYFTGLHSDYHRPTDDFDKINYTGEAHILRHINSLIEMADQQPGKPVFTKTREVQMGTSARFAVSLGIMPDYTFSGTGVRVDGISDGKAAQKAGLQTGDVITGLGSYPVSSMESYMQALSKFAKGDRTTVKYLRGTTTAMADVIF